jgi:uncharacterized protein
MVLKRKIANDLLKWKNKEDKMPLVVKGARQIGKTFSIDDFCQKNYANYLYINFEKDITSKAAFDGNLDVDTIISYLSTLYTNVNLIPYNTIIFLDEIQSCPNARTSLKFFAQDKRYDIIASGSLLGLNTNQVSSFPVGYNEQLTMYSLDFEEFCWANGQTEENIINLKKFFDTKKEIPSVIHNKFMELFKQYIIVGGMPMIVNNFISNHDFSMIYDLQKRIINDYLDDIAKYAEMAEKKKARECFLSIPFHLAQDYKKFKYSNFDKTGSSRKYGGSLMWLYDAGIINYCYKIKNFTSPLNANVSENDFKIYMVDIGLLMAMYEKGMSNEILNGNLGICKGAIYENVIADILTKKGLSLYYFENNSTLEIDFVIWFNNEITPVEVKSGDNTKSKSLKTVINNWGPKQGIRLSSKNIGYKDNVYCFPLYMSMFL